MVEKYFVPRPLTHPLSLSMGSQHGHDSYQITDNHECSNMIANSFPAYPLPPSFPPSRPWEWGQ